VNATVVQAVSVSDAPFWAWWIAPVAVTVAVAVAGALARRDRRPRDGFEAVEDYARFREAMTVVRRPTPRPKAPEVPSPTEPSQTPPPQDRG
jgi:hypothetical protein